MLNTWGLGVSTFGFCGCWAPRVFNAPYKCRFSASWYLTDRAYCEDIINVLQLLFPLLEQLLAMRGTCGCQTPTVRVDVIWTQRGSVVLNAESKMFYRSDQVDQQHCGDVGVDCSLLVLVGGGLAQLRLIGHRNRGVTVGKEDLVHDSWFVANHEF